MLKVRYEGDVGHFDGLTYGIVYEVIDENETQYIVFPNDLGAKSHIQKVKFSIIEMHEENNDNGWMMNIQTENAALKQEIKRLEDQTQIYQTSIDDLMAIRFNQTQEIKQLKEGMGHFSRLSSIVEEKCALQEQELVLLKDWRSHLKNTLEHIEKLETDRATLLAGLDKIMYQEANHFSYDTPAYTIARECFAQVGGIADES